MAPVDQMEPLETVLTRGPGLAGVAPFPGPICRSDELEPPSVIQAFRWIPNCAALAFGMDARHVARSCQFQPAVPDQLRRDLQV